MASAQADGPSSFGAELLASPDAPLAELFASVSAAAEGASSLGRDAAAWGAALAAARRCVGRVEAAALFSSNEDRDDLATGAMKFLLARFYLAELLSAGTGGGGAAPGGAAGPAARRKQVDEAAAHYAAFLHRLEQYRLLGPLAEQLRDAEGDAEASGSGCALTARRSTGPAADAAAQRTRKVEQFKRERAAAAALKQLQERRAAAAGAAAVAAAAADGGDAPSGQGYDEEDERALWALRLELAALRAAGQRPLLEQEAALLRHAEAAAADAAARGDGGGAGAGPGSDADAAAAMRAQMAERMAGIAGSLGASDRGRLRAAVFRPSHTLPTMTVEEFGEVELAEAIARDARAAKGAAAAAAARAARSADDLEEEATRKARDWDDFTDANPKGSGNSKLRPCG